MEKQDNNIKTLQSRINILIIIVLIVSIVLYSKFNSIEQRLDYINNAVNNNSMFNVNYSQIADIVAEELENQTYLNVQTQWSGEYDNKHINIDCTAILNQASKDDIVKLFYKDDNSSQYKSVTLVKDEGLRYSGSFTVELFKEYEYYVTLEGETLKSSKIAPIPREHYLIEPIKFGAEVGMRNGKDESVNIYFDNYLIYKTLIKGLTFESYRIDIYSNQNLIDSKTIIDVLEEDKSEILFKDYDETIDRIVIVAILNDGLELEQVIYTNSSESAIVEEKN